MTPSDDQREAATWPDNDPTFTPEPILWHVQLRDETRDCDGTYPLTPRYVMARCEDDAGNRAGEDFDMTEGLHATGQHDTRPATPAEVDAFAAALSSRPALPAGGASERIEASLSRDECGEIAGSVLFALASRPSSPQAGDEAETMFTCDGCGYPVEAIEAFRESGDEGAEALRRALAVVGWSSTPGGKDYCDHCTADRPVIPVADERGKLIATMKELGDENFNLSVPHHAKAVIRLAVAALEPDGQEGK